MLVIPKSSTKIDTVSRQKLVIYAPLLNLNLVKEGKGKHFFKKITIVHIFHTQIKLEMTKSGTPIPNKDT